MLGICAVKAGNLVAGTGKWQDALFREASFDPVQNPAQHFHVVLVQIEAEKAAFQRVKSAQQTQHEVNDGETVRTDSLADIQQHEVNAEEADSLKEIATSAALDALVGGEVAHVVDAVSVIVESLGTPLNGAETHTHYKTKKAEIKPLSDLEGEL